MTDDETPQERFDRLSEPLSEVDQEDENNTDPMDVDELLGEPLSEVPKKDPDDENCNGKRKEKQDDEYVFAGYCASWPGRGTDHVGEGRCKNHGGNNGDNAPPAPEGNDYAKDNDGGAPENNQNSMKTGLHSDPVGLFKWLEEHEPKAAAWILQKVIAFSIDTPFDVFTDSVESLEEFENSDTGLTAKGDELLQTCVRDYARWRAAKRQLEEGIITKQTRQGESGRYEVMDSNPVNLDLDRMDRTVTKVRKDLGVSDDPESQRADAEHRMADLWEKDLTD